MVRRRAGHSLVELVVAVAFLGAVLTTVANAAWLGARAVDRALLGQAAIRRAAFTLDSLATAPTFAAGSARKEGLTVRWSPGADGRVVVTVERIGGGDPLVTLSGRRVPVIPVLPDRP